MGVEWKFPSPDSRWYIYRGRFEDQPTGKVLSMLLSKLIGPVASEDVLGIWGFLMTDGC